MHLINPSFTKTYYMIRTQFRALLALSMFIVFVAIILSGMQDVIRDRTHDSLLQYNLVGAEDPLFTHPLSGHTVSAAVVGVSALFIYGCFLLLMSSWRRQARFDKNHAKVLSKTEEIFDSVGAPVASMATINWTIVIERTVQKGVPMTSIRTTLERAEPRLFALPSRFSLLVSEKSMTEGRGVLASLRVRAVLRLLDYLARLYDDRTVSKAYYTADVRRWDG